MATDFMAMGWVGGYMSGFQPLVRGLPGTWAYGPGWYMSHLWRFLVDAPRQAVGVILSHTRSALRVIPPPPY
jgi:hypothetical protein